MKKLSQFSLLLSLVFLISSCSLGRPEKLPDVDYLSSGTEIDIKKFFNGDLEGFAIIQNEKGKISDTQIIKINGKWDDDKGVVQQNVIHSDGTKDGRTWLFTINRDGTFEAVGHDVARPARGRQIGNVLQMVYALSIPHNSVRRQVDFEDRIYMVDEKSAIMISKFRKGFGSYGKAIISLKKTNYRPESKPEKAEPTAEANDFEVEEISDEKVEPKVEKNGEAKKEIKYKKPNSAKVESQKE